MEYLPQALASVAAILGPLAAIIGLIHSRGWLVAVGAIFATAAIGFFIYVKHQRQRLASASIEIEGLSIDAVNAANLRRRINRSLTVQTAEQHVTIDGADLEMDWRYVGFCRAERETVIEFSVDSSRNISFDELDCNAFDLRRDPDRRHPIKPMLIGPDGISKKIAITFSEPLRRNDPFDLALRCHLPGVFPPTAGYYTSSLSLDQKRVGRSIVNLRFVQQKPNWVRVYTCDSAGRSRLLKSLNAMRGDSGETEYRDVAENIEAQSIRVYRFERA